jgi:hypothetical protein
VLGITTIRPSVALALAGAAICIAVVAGCAGGDAPAPGPSFYQNLAQPDMTVDPAAAASMISGYRSNNGLGPVSVDPDLMRMANEQALAMAQHDTMNHDIGKPFKERVGNSPFANVVVVENVSAGYHTLAEAFSGWRDSPPHRANMLNRAWILERSATGYANLICTSLPSSLRIAWKGVLKPRHFLGVRLAVMTMS